MSQPTHRNLVLGQQPAGQLSDAPTPAPTEFIHNFSDIDWQSDDEPPYPLRKHTAATPSPLYYLLTIMGQLIVGYYPHDTHTLGEHYLAWAPVHAADAFLQ